MLDSIMDYIVAWFMLCINHLIELVVALADTMLVPVVSALPDLRMETAFLMKVIGLANQFIALDYGVILFTAFLIFALAVSLVNWVLGLIPTIN